MSADVQLISDGQGLAVIGSPTAVDLFLAAEKLASKNLNMPRLASALKVGAQVAELAPEIMAMKGRWVELTQETRHLVAGLKSATSGVSTGVATAGKSGQMSNLVGFAKDSASQLANNPAVLSGAAGLMAQLAMQQTMDE